ncbi:MAG: uracil-DNA glycosylase, partial [Sphingobium sp.]|nr:uracil-DNA glycosylase [Sphingobium sp.]
MSGTIKLHESWREALADQFAAPHMQGLKAFLE